MSAALFQTRPFKAGLTSPDSGLVWELWRLSRWTIVCCWVFQFLLSFLLLADSAPTSGSTPKFAHEYFQGLGLKKYADLMVTSFVMMACSAAGGLSIMFEHFSRVRTPFERMYARPIDTQTLVLVTMTYVFVATALPYMLSATIFGALFDIPYPILSTGVQLSVATLVTVSVIWILSGFRSVGSYAVLGAYFGIALVAILWRINYPGEILGLGPMSPAAFAYVSAVGVLTAPLTIYAVGLQRHIPSSGASSIFAIQPTLNSSRAAVASLDRLWKCPTFSPIAAQIWYEMRVSGFRVLLLAACGGGVLAGVMAIVKPSDTDIGSEPNIGNDSTLSTLELLVGLFVLACGFLNVSFSLGLKRRRVNPSLPLHAAIMPVESMRLLIIKGSVTAFVYFTVERIVFALVEFATGQGVDWRLSLAEVFTSVLTLSALGSPAFASATCVIFGALVGFATLVYAVSMNTETNDIRWESVWALLFGFLILLPTIYLSSSIFYIQVYFDALGIVLLIVWIVAWTRILSPGYAYRKTVLRLTVGWMVILAVAAILWADVLIKPNLATSPVILFGAGLLTLPLSSIVFASMAYDALRHR